MVEMRKCVEISFHLLVTSRTIRNVNGIELIDKRKAEEQVANELIDMTSEREKSMKYYNFSCFLFDSFKFILPISISFLHN